MSDPEPGTSRASSLLSFPSPKKKRTKKGPLTSSEKQILINVFKYVEETWPKHKYPYKKEIVEKTGEIMGMSVPTVYSVLKEYKTTHRVESPPPPAIKPSLVDSLDDMDLSAIRRKVHQFFFENEMPTIDKILESINMDDSLPNLKRDVLYKVLKKLGFKYSKRNRKNMLIDKPDIVVWRVKYLNEMAKFRKDGRKIYYLDETWVNEGHTKSSTWQDTTILSTKYCPKHSRQYLTGENWQNCEGHVIKEEQKMLTLDKVTDDITERFVIHVGDTSSSSDSD